MISIIAPYSLLVFLSQTLVSACLFKTENRDYIVLKRIFNVSLQYLRQSRRISVIRYDAARYFSVLFFLPSLTGQAGQEKKDYVWEIFWSYT